MRTVTLPENKLATSVELKELHQLLAAAGHFGWQSAAGQRLNDLITELMQKYTKESFHNNQDW